MAADYGWDTSSRQILQSLSWDPCGETTLIGMAVDEWDVAMAQQIYGAALVHRARLLERTTSLTALGTGKEQQRAAPTGGRGVGCGR